MDRPVISFYSYELEYIGTVGVYTSLQWQNAVYIGGDIEIHIPMPYFVPLIKAVEPDCFVKIDRDVKENYALIQYVEYTDNGNGNAECVIKGKTLSYLWSWRTPSLRTSDEYESGSIKLSETTIFQNFRTITESSYRVTGQTQYNNNLRFWDGITYTDKTEGGDVFEFESSVSDTHSILENYCKTVNCGYYCRLLITSDTKKMEVTVYTPKENSGVIFDFARGNLSKFSYVQTDDGEKNAFYYLKKNENNVIQNSNIVTTYNYDNILGNIGDRPKVIYCGVFEDAHMATAEGNKKLSELTKSESADGETEINYYDYLTDFNVGDIVTISHSEWGVSLKKVIYSVREVWETNYICNVCFGEPQDIVYRKLKKQLGR